MARPSGRRPGKQDTRGEIVDAARQVFSEQGFESATIRRIAERAGVDPALVHHYFGSKQELFVAVVKPPFDPDEFVPTILSGDLENLGERLASTFVAILENPTTGPAVISMVRGAMGGEAQSGLLRDFYTSVVLRRVADELSKVMPAEEARLRASLLASQLLGLVTAGYILGLEPLAGLEPEQVVRIITPTLQNYLTSPLGS